MQQLKHLLTGTELRCQNRCWGGRSENDIKPEVKEMSRVAVHSSGERSKVVQLISFGSLGDGEGCILGPGSGYARLQR